MRATRPMGFNTYTFAQSSQRQQVAEKLNSAKWALSFLGAVVGVLDYKDSVWYKWSYLYVVVDRTDNGKYIKIRRVTRDGEFYGTHASWGHASKYYRAFDSMHILKLESQIETLKEQAEQAQAKADQSVNAKLSQLSQNTVTRALVHAYSNDYCHETAVALISAGHKMPDVTLELEVTIPVSITLRGNDSYYALRELFGRTSGEVDGAKGLDLMNGRGADKVAEQINNVVREQGINIYNSTVTHQDTAVDWKDPILRTVPERDAMREVSSYGMD